MASGLTQATAVVHTDDIAWAHSRFGWADLLTEGILVPVRQGLAVSCRPSRWAGHGREGSIEVPAGCLLLVIEGDGAGRREVADLIDALIWVQSDERATAGRRRIARSGRSRGTGRCARRANGLRESSPASPARPCGVLAACPLCPPSQKPRTRTR